MPVAGGASAPQIVVVHRRQVVMHQAVGVDEFDRGGRAIELIEWSAQRFAGRVHEYRPQALAAAEHAVAHGLVQAARFDSRRGEPAIKGPLDARLIARDSIRQARWSRASRSVIARVVSAVVNVLVNVLGFECADFAHAGLPEEYLDLLLGRFERGLAACRSTATPRSKCDSASSSGRSPCSRRSTTASSSAIARSKSGVGGLAVVAAGGFLGGHGSLFGNP